MRLGLRMGLNSRQGGGGDLPSLDIAFALDKTLTARKGPTPAFTRSSTATFVGSNGLIQSAIIDAPRFDHDPTTGVCKGLLIEESRTNLLTYSEQLNNIAWTKNGSTITADATTSPDGTVDAERTTENLGTNARVGTFFTLSVGAASVPYTFSIFIKNALGSRFARIVLNADNATTFACVDVNPATGEIAQTLNSNTSAVSSSSMPFGNGWWRVSITATLPVRYVTLALVTGPAVPAGIDFGYQSYAGDGNSGIFAWGAQLEAGAFPTSYIPTTSGTAARSADVCSIVGDAFASFYNQSEGTLFARYSVVAGFSITGRTVPVCAISNQSFNEAIRIGSPTSNLNMAFDTVASSIQTRILATSPISLIGSNTAAGAYKINDSGFSSNSATTLSGSPASITTLVNRFDIGGLHPGSAVLPLNGHIARIQYFRKRLSNEKLQTLTTL